MNFVMEPNGMKPNDAQNWASDASTGVIKGSLRFRYGSMSTRSEEHRRTTVHHRRSVARRIRTLVFSYRRAFVVNSRSHAVTWVPIFAVLSTLVHFFLCVEEGNVGYGMFLSGAGRVHRRRQR